jgi:hypothetical protein
MNTQLKEREDFYYNEDGYMVFTAAYHLKKEKCCGNGCRHCPYNYINVDANKQAYFRKKNAEYQK